MDVRVMYGTDQEAAIKKYSQELESRGILLLIRTAIQIYNVAYQDRIDVEMWRIGYSAEDRQSFIAINLQKLKKKEEYNQAHIRLPQYPAKDLKALLLKFLWMGYGQLPEFTGSELDSSKYLNWKYFQKSLVSLGEGISCEN